jgi:hypothetical protein
VNRGILVWLWVLCFGEDGDRCRLCAQDVTAFPSGAAPAIAPGCESDYCRKCCRRHCECGAGQKITD